MLVSGALVWLAVNSIAASRHHYEHVDKFRQIIKPGWLPYSTGIDLTDIQVLLHNEMTLQCPAQCRFLYVCLGCNHFTLVRVRFFSISVSVRA